MSQDDFEILFRGLVISVVTVSFMLGVVLTITGRYDNTSMYSRDNNVHILYFSF